MTALFATGSQINLLAHQGGWDEILLIGGPMLIIVGLLWLAKRRVDAAAAADVSHRAGPHVTDADAERPV